MTYQPASDKIDDPSKGNFIRALNNSQFRVIWASSWCFYIARMMELAVLLWLVLELTDSPSNVALVGIFRTAPMFLLGLVVGTLADHFPRKYLLLTAQSTNAITAAVVAILLASGNFQFWYAYIAIFVTGCAWASDFSSRRALLSDIFTGDRLVNAISLDSAVLTGGNMLGPLLGGIMIYLGGFEAAYIVLALLYALGTVCLMFVRSGQPNVADERNTEIPSQWNALSKIKGNPVVVAVLLTTITFNLFAFPFNQMLPMIAKHTLGAGPVLYGILGSSVGLGAIVGSLIIGTGRFKNHGSLFSLGASLMLIALFVFSFSNSYYLSLCLLLIAGFGMSGFAVLQPIIVLQAIPSYMRGRALGAIALCIGFNPLGVFFVGQLAELWGAEIGLSILSGVGIIVMFAVRWRYPSLRDKSGPSRSHEN